MAAAITDRTRLIFVCNPNNPTGTAVPGDAADGVPGRRCPPTCWWCWTRPTASSSPTRRWWTGSSLLGRYPNLIVLRTFSKAYGLAGLRVGYGIAADPAVAAGGASRPRCRSRSPSVAQAAALASLEHEAEKQLAERVR